MATVFDRKGEWADQRQAVIPDVEGDPGSADRSCVMFCGDPGFQFVAPG